MPEEVNFKMEVVSSVGVQWSPETGWSGSSYSLEGGVEEIPPDEAEAMHRAIFGDWVFDLMKEIAEKEAEE